MNNYVLNKQPKDPRLCKLILKTITINRKELGLEFDDVANELGLQPGTLKNKLKPSYDMGDMTLTEFTHFLELTGDYAALEYIANKFDMVLIPKKQAKADIKDINKLVDKVSMESSDVFKAVKQAIEDGVITPEEREAILKEIEEDEQAIAELRDKIEHITLQEE